MRIEQFGRGVGQVGDDGVEFGVDPRLRPRPNITTTAPTPAPAGGGVLGEGLIGARVVGPHRAPLVTGAVIGVVLADQLVTVPRKHC